MLVQAINTIKANATGLTRVNNVKAEPHKELIKPKSTELLSVKPESSPEVPKNQSSSSVLPPNFFDDNETKKQKPGTSLYLIFLLNIITIICQYCYYLVHHQFLSLKCEVQIESKGSNNVLFISV